MLNVMVRSPGKRRRSSFALCGRGTIALLLCAPAIAAQAPIATPVAVVRPVRDVTPARVRPIARSEMSLSRGQRTATGLIVGALAGAAVGALVARQEVHRAGLRDHSEDGMVYAVYITGGTVVGAVVGLAAGFLTAK